MRWPIIDIVAVSAAAFVATLFGLIAVGVVLFSLATPVVGWLGSIIAALGLGYLTVVFEVRWRREELRRATRRCTHCGYDLRATRDRCPECGRPVSQNERTNEAET